MIVLTSAACRLDGLATLLVSKARPAWLVAYCCTMLALPALSAKAADFSEARAIFFRGDYAACIEVTQAEVDRGIWNDYWSRLLVETLLTTGQYERARAVYEQVASKFSNSLPLRVLGAEVYRYCGEGEKGQRLLDEIPDLVQSAPWRYSDRDNMLTIGKYLLAEGEDARAVLDAFYDRSLKSDPKFVDAHIAIAELALDKADFQEAVNSLKLAQELRPEDPQIRCLLAKAWAPSDSALASENLQAALELNPKHINSLLLQAENLIDGEAYEAASQVIDEVFGVNPAEPRGWALKAAIAHLTGNYQSEGECRSTALAHWDLNPAVDYLIGKTLSEHYRFAEGVKYQRRALRMDPGFLPARFQLAQDLLRVGADDEGWTIVDQVAAADKYNVVAYNLKTLQTNLAKFTTLEAPGLLVRMDSREAKIYGARVLDLLQTAHQHLATKYGVELTRPVTVEIFPQQSDFAIRTFGLPGGEGFLGVCFGNLITANSPASQGTSPSNWESVLWHEYCHVITLNKTQNRMPRWLSEGISVYEELQRDASWGQRMSPMYREMLLGDDFVPLSQLSRAFLAPKSPLHLQFAYFESSLAVRYLIDVHGLPLLLKLLDDLGFGMPIAEAFARRYGDTEQLDEDFEKYVKSLAGEFYATTDFDRLDLADRPTRIDLDRLLAEHPDNYFAQRALTERLVLEQDWEAAVVAAQRLVELYPQDDDAGGGLELLAACARELGNTELERSTLEQMTAVSGDNVPALTRLMQLAREAEDWEALAQASRKLLAVQPLLTTAHTGMVTAAEALDRPQLAIESLTALLELAPVDPAELQFKLAQAQFAVSETADARLSVLRALELSPRYREAQKLLVAVHAAASGDNRRAARPEEGQPPRPAAPAASTD